MSPESFTNALLITLISLITAIAGVGYKKINELIAEVRAFRFSDQQRENQITNILDDITDHTKRISQLENNKQSKHNY